MPDCFGHDVLSQDRSETAVYSDRITSFWRGDW
jgi:hypothetical protein